MKITTTDQAIEHCKEKVPVVGINLEYTAQENADGTFTVTAKGTGQAQGFRLRNTYDRDGELVSNPA